ncbi:MAG: hypothetical protein ACP5IM_07525 [Candidatus Bathyarchaeia archaeon]
MFEGLNLSTIGDVTLKIVYDNDAEEGFQKGFGFSCFITGCAHPGLENILRFASKFGEIHGIVGGFHDFSRLKTLRGTRLIVPCHCTMRKIGILSFYPRNSIRRSVGCTIRI